jgi:hypothetical protein
MSNRVCFSTFDLFRDNPNVCGVCMSSAPIFRYEFIEDGEDIRSEYIKGFCCASCAAKLLEVLEDVERRDWTREQAALEAEGIEVTEFHNRRIAAFGNPLENI